MTDPTPRRPWGPWLALAVGLAALVFSAFWAHRADFFVADDFSAVYAASRTQTLVEAFDLRGAFREQLVREVIPDASLPPALLRPLVTLSIWLDSLWSGLAPHGYHIVAFALHALNALLVALLARALGAGILAAAIASVAFALHPTHPEAVVWIAARADLMVTTFMLGALLGWLRWLEDGRQRWLVWCVVGFVLALATKEMAATLPGLAAALACAHRTKGSARRAVGGVVLLGGILAGYVVVRWALIGNLTGYAPRPGGLLGEVTNVARYLLDAVHATLMPGDRVAHPAPDALRLVTGTAWVALALAALGAGAGHRLAWPAAALVAAFVLSTVPAAVWGTLAPNTEGSRLLYPSLAFAAAGIALLADAGLAHARARWLTGLAVAALFVGSALGLQRSLVPWGKAAALTAHIVADLRTVAGGKTTFVLTNELPRSVGPAYACQNAFPPAIWAFVSPGARVEWVSRKVFDELLRDRADFIRANAETVAPLRWDARRNAWVGPNVRR